MTTSAAIFQACVEGSTDAIMLTDVEGRIFYTNKAWQAIYGYSSSEAEGKTPRLLRSGHHDRAFYQEMWKQILDPKKGFWKGEVINRARNGTEIPMLLTISPFRDADGTTAGYMSIAVDIREKKELEAQVMRQDRLASIGLLASGLAHEIGTPLGVVRGRAEYLLGDAPAGSAMHRSLEVIVGQIDRVTKLIYSLLNLARTSPSDTTMPVRLRDVIDDVYDLVAERLKASHITFEVDVDRDVHVAAESGRLEQVFLNLFMNAIYAIDAANRAGRKQGHRLAVEVVPRDSAWVIDVKDTGCGISKENLDHLFKPFFTTKPVGEGTGLGLAVTHQILQAWAGRLWVDSTEGVGTTFHLQIPKAAGGRS